jgi:hypothetical protein
VSGNPTDVDAHSSRLLAIVKMLYPSQNHYVIRDLWVEAAGAAVSIKFWSSCSGMGNPLLI